MDSNVVQNITYRYVVTVTDWLETESAYSTEASAPPPAPRLAVVPSTDSRFITITWPAAAVGYRLTSATNLAPPVQWLPESGAILSNSLWNYAAPGSNGGQRFFRIQSP